MTTAVVGLDLFDSRLNGTSSSFDEPTQGVPGRRRSPRSPTHGAKYGKGVGETFVSS